MTLREYEKLNYIMGLVEGFSMGLPDGDVKDALLDIADHLESLVENAKVDKEDTP